MARRSEAALEELYDATSPWIHGLALRILRDVQLAEEVTHDVYLQAWRRAREYRPDRGSVRSWLVTMTRSRSLDRLRSERSREERLRRGLEERSRVLESMRDDDRTVDSTREGLGQALVQLPLAQREAISLAFLGGLTHPEIARALDRPLGTVKTQIRQGLLRLRTLLGSPSSARSPQSSTPAPRDLES